MGTSEVFAKLNLKDQSEVVVLDPPDNEDWSALRFRRAEFIKKLTRDPPRTLSRIGKKRTAKRK